MTHITWTANLGDLIEFLTQARPLANRLTIVQLLRSFMRERLVEFETFPDRLEFYPSSSLPPIVLERQEPKSSNYDPLTETWTSESLEAFLVQEWIENLLTKEPQESKLRLILEVENSLDNLTFALAQYLRICSLSKEGEVPQENCPELFFERWTIFGHNQHPCSKTRMGLEPEQVIDFGSEFFHSQEILLLDIPSHLINNVGSDWPFKADKEGFTRTPIHSWQWEYLQQEKPEAASLCQVSDCSISCFNGSSFRTYFAQEQALCLKLPLHIQITSCERTLGHYTIQNGPVYSKILNAIKAENSIFHNAHFLKEYSGLWAEPNSALGRECNLLLREDLRSLAPNSYDIIPLSSLLSYYPGSSEDIFKKIFCHSHIDILQSYLELLLPPLYVLLCQYGIGLECHLQNTVLILKDGLPQKVAHRDWGGLRAYVPYITSYSTLAQKLVTAPTVKNNWEDVYTKFFSCLFCNHLEELFQLFEHHTKKSADSYYAFALKTLEQAIEQTAVHNQEHEAMLEQLVQVVSKRDFKIKALTTMRLHPDRGDIYLSPHEHSHKAAR